MNMIQKPLGLGTRTLSAGHVDLYSSPGWCGTLERATLEGMLHQMTSPLTREFTWRVRFDHHALVKGLADLGLTARLQDTHVIHIHDSYERIVAGYSPTKRNHISKARRRGLVIQKVRCVEDLSACQLIYRSLAGQKGWRFVYPLELLFELAKLTDVSRFLIAQHEGRIVGGALFLKDGCSITYLMGVADRAYGELFPAPALIDEGIRWACEIGADFFNMGTAGSNKSLARFKASFGCSLEQDRIFEWRNPCFKTLKRIVHACRRGARLFRVLGTRTATPPSTTIDQGASKHSLAWSNRAALGELQAVLNARGSERENLLMHGSTLVAAESIFGLVGKVRGRKPILLDFGCGNGRMIRLFAKKPWTVLGTDISSEMLEAARRLGLPNNAKVFRTNGVSIPLESESVDVIWVCGVLKYSLFPAGSRCLHGCLDLTARHAPTSNEDTPLGSFYNPAYRYVLRELHRVLKTSGLIVQLEMWVDSPPGIFTQGFTEAGFLNVEKRVLRRYSGWLEKTIERLPRNLLPTRFVVPVGKASARFRMKFDNPYRVTGHFKDYYFVWRKRTDFRDSAEHKAASS
jgi:SAM-dependent methyltransferase